MWRELVALTFLVLLLCAAMVANLSDGPMREYRGSWVTHASQYSAVEAGPIRIVLVGQFGLAEKSFEISQPGARQLFGIMLSCLPPLLQMSLEQAPPFIRLMNILCVARYIVQAVSTACRSRSSSAIAQPLRTRDRIRQLHLLLKVSIFSESR